MYTCLVIHGQSFIENKLDQVVKVPTLSVNKRLGYGIIGFPDQILTQFIFLPIVFSTLNNDIGLIMFNIVGWNCSFS